MIPEEWSPARRSAVFAEVDGAFSSRCNSGGDRLQSVVAVSMLKDLATLFFSLFSSIWFSLQVDVVLVNWLLD